MRDRIGAIPRFLGELQARSIPKLLLRVSAHMQLSDRVTGLFPHRASAACAAYGGSRLPPVPGQQVGPNVFPMVVGVGLDPVRRLDRARHRPALRGRSGGRSGGAFRSGPRTQRSRWLVARPEGAGAAGAAALLRPGRRPARLPADGGGHRAHGGAGARARGCVLPSRWRSPRRCSSTWSSPSCCACRCRRACCRRRGEDAHEHDSSKPSRWCCRPMCCSRSCSRRSTAWWSARCPACPPPWPRRCWCR